MKKTISILGMVFGMIFCCLFAAGCGDDSSSSAQSAVPESAQSEHESLNSDAETVRKAAEDFYGRIRSESSKSRSIKDAVSSAGLSTEKDKFMSFLEDGTLFSR